jgi:dolichol-phosphate mannosyltransferase
MRTLVVLPTYDEILNVEPMLRTLREVVPDCDILVVDDASPDGTARMAEKIAGELGQIEVVTRAAKSGLPRPPGAAGVAGGGRELRRRHRLALRPGRPHPPVVLHTPDALARRQSVRDDHARPSRRRLDVGVPGLLSLGARADRLRDRHRGRLRLPDRDDLPGPAIVEVPISFTDRERGQSKMSSAIVVEALALVTKWALERPFRRGY